jgi:serine/threonine protein kinase
VTPDFSPTVGALAPGDHVAGYQIEAQIGRGGMAVVYRALDLRLNRQVALKVLAPQLGDDDAFRQRFIRESRAAAGVDHPHIIPVFEAGEAGRVLFIAMRYVAYGDLRTLIETEGRLSAGRTVAIAGQVASALDAAHAQGLVHRDVKPGNVLLDATGGSGTDHVYLSDFGLSKDALATTTLTAAGQFMGTLDYVSPEQIQGHTADGRADQYALACTVVEMLSGAPPYKRDESMALLWAQLEAPPPDLTRRRPDLPPAVDAVMRTALAKSPADRYPSCLAFAGALRAACGPGLARRPVTEAAAGPLLPAPTGNDQSFARPAGSASAFERGYTRADPVPSPVPPWPETAAVPPQRPPTDRELAARDASGRGAGRRGFPGAAPGPPPREPHLRPQRQPASQRGRRRAVAGVASLVVLAGLAVAGFMLLHKNSPAAPTAPAAKTLPVAAPAAVVRAYFADINAHRFARAWRLNAADHGSENFQQFVAGFTGTKLDTVTISSKDGNVVSIRLAAAQDDGTVKTYQGTYTVVNGVITTTDIQQTGG